MGAATAHLGQEPAPGWLSAQWLSYFGAGRRPAQRHDGKFVDDAFVGGAAEPLALGGEALLARVRQLIGANLKQEEVRWTSRVDGAKERRRAAQSLAAQESERTWQVWLQVQFGGERRIDVARACGYSDGSAITHRSAATPIPPAATPSSRGATPA